MEATLGGFKAWLKNPLHGSDGETSAVEVFCLVGLVIISAIAWRIILTHIVSD